MASSLAAKTQGAAAQYGVAAQSGKVAYDSTQILPAAAASTIIGTVPPGKAGIRLTSPVIQNATVLTTDGTAGLTGNALLPTSGVGVVPTVNSAQAASAGLSLSPEHE
jgi:hypothetical protein